MKIITERPFYLLLVAPLLILMQFTIGYYIISRIAHLDAMETKHNRMELYLRNQLMYLINAETGQRGYLLTDNREYLEPYTLGLQQLEDNDTLLNGITTMVDTEQFNKLNALTSKKLQFMASTIELNSRGMKDSALAMVNTNVGKLTMDSIRDNIDIYLSYVSANLEEGKRKLNRLLYFFVFVMVLLFIFQIAFSFYGYHRVRLFSESTTQLVDELNVTNKSLRQFTFMSYHQLKEPLRNLSGFSQLLRRKNEDKLDDESKEYIQHVIDASKQMNKIVNDLRKNHLDTGVEDE